MCTSDSTCLTTEASPLRVEVTITCARRKSVQVLSQIFVVGAETVRERTRCCRAGHGCISPFRSNTFLILS